MVTLHDPIQFHRGDAAELAADNPVFLRGTLNVEIDTGQAKFGDGVTPWNSLPYIGDGGGTVAVYEVQLDDAGSGVTYVGEADPGSGNGSAVWRIKRITETGLDLHVDWADGVSTFTKVWDSRAGYTYS